MNVLFLADNTNRSNWGCRGTSIALKEIIQEKHNISYTIYGEHTNGYHPFHLRNEYISYNDRIRMALCRRNIFSSMLLRTDPYNIIKDTITDTYTAYKKMMNGNPLHFYKEIDDQIKNCDAVVCNGEGTFIFSNPPRYDSIFYSLILLIAQEYGKKTYLLNAMFSDCPRTGRNHKLIREVSGIFSRCTMVSARDPLSFSYYTEHIGDNAIYMPDALFSWTKFSDYIPIARLYPRVFVPFPENTDTLNDYDCSLPFICLSGSSAAAWNQTKAIESYTELASELKKHYNLWIVQCADGDRFLHQVAQYVNCPFVNVSTNIYLGMSILSNASVFVSGRWHPSIMASIGGTPCIFLGSNSHKTQAIQYMLEYSNIKEYQALPNRTEISNIVADCQKKIMMGTIERSRIISVVNKLSDMIAPPNNSLYINYLHSNIAA